MNTKEYETKELLSRFAPYYKPHNGDALHGFILCGADNNLRAGASADYALYYQRRNPGSCGVVRKDHSDVGCIVSGTAYY